MQPGVSGFWGSRIDRLDRPPLLEESHTGGKRCRALTLARRARRDGLCPAFINDPFNAHPPVCDQPGTRCGEEAIRWKSMYNQTIVETFLVSMASFCLYLISVGAKSKFYRLSRELVNDYDSDKSN